MKPLIILLAVFLCALPIIKLVKRKWDPVLAGNIAMTAMLLFTAIGHFIFPKGMTMMLPDFLPFKETIVYLTGVIEIAAAIGLLLPAWRTTTAWLLIVFFILILPANIIAAVRHVNIEKGTLDGPGISYLWFRIPLQLLFIVWVCWFSLGRWTVNEQAKAKTEQDGNKEGVRPLGGAI